ncbi:NurA domain protein [Ferroglobus placidus DSM 10642]|uniref:NurA domain protein n=1 Tax=Ferroglobus placidus (strain DSM 10642 / AEDII12DO) TaxID=589924 RepID=D3RZ27_FERPA|nr:DNA double-strand break repair nuclease NurA [Ferroglobus placidus]ADC65740.1 NurA domain protein [Ferroglobus placidus DSM 10642]
MKFEGKLIENVAKIREIYRQNEVAELPDLEKKKVVLEDLKSFLKGLKVAGVDGSQISPLKDFGLPFGGVQAARLVVEHGSGKYDLKYKSGVAHETSLELERFRLEVEMLKEIMGEELYAFYDGSFSVFFTSEMSEKLRRAYLKELEELLKLSEEEETALIAYVDRSYSREIFQNAYDSYVLRNYLLMFEYIEPIRRGNLLITYFKVNPTFPAKVEMPAWLEDRVEEILKVIMAECLISSTSGYPYILERVHKYATISEKEKEEFVKAVGARVLSYKFVSKLTSKR